MQIHNLKMLVLSLTGDCNFACKYCYAAEHNTSMMSLDTAMAAVNLAAQSKNKFILQFSGGEPLLNFSVIQCLAEYVKKENIPAVMQIQTNASLITDEVALYLKEHKIAVGVSLDGTPKVNDKLRIAKNNKSASAETIRGIEILKKYNMACGITCVVTEDNVKEMPEIVDMAYFLGNVRRIGFDLLRSQGRGSNLLPPDEEILRKSISEVYERAKELHRLIGYKIEFSQQENSKDLLLGTECEFGHCYAMNGQAAFVDAKGDIYSCSSLVGNKKYFIGNVYTGIEENLLKEVKERIRQAMSFCKFCKDFKNCGGGCFARWYVNEKKQKYVSECHLKKISKVYALRNK